MTRTINATTMRVIGPEGVRDRRLGIRSRGLRLQSAGVDEPDHPDDALIRVVAPLKAVSGLEQGVAVDHAAQHADRVVEFVGSDAVTGQDGPDRVDHPGGGSEQRVVATLKLRTSGGVVAPRILGNVGLERREERADRVPQRIIQLGHRQGCDAVLQVADAIDVLVQCRCLDTQSFGKSSETHRSNADFVGEFSTGDHYLRGVQVHSRHGRAR